jgi:hypothetical protein
VCNNDIIEKTSALVLKHIMVPSTEPNKTDTVIINLSHFGFFNLYSYYLRINSLHISSFKFPVEKLSLFHFLHLTKSSCAASFCMDSS